MIIKKRNHISLIKTIESKSQLSNKNRMYKLTFKASVMNYKLYTQRLPNFRHEQSTPLERNRQAQTAEGRRENVVERDLILSLSFGKFSLSLSLSLYL
jgi:hypothetical protein